MRSVGSRSLLLHLTSGCHCSGSPFACSWHRPVAGYHFSTDIRLGTWVPLEKGEELAVRNNVYERVRPIFEFVPGNDSPPPAPKHTTNKPKVPKKPAVPRFNSK
jgi:hypothetical protein